MNDDRNLHPEDYEDKSPEEIKADIVRTRAEMSKTVDELQDKLSPENLKAQAKEQAQEAIQNVKDQAREKIMSVKDTLVGTVEDKVHDTGEKIGEAGAEVTEWVQANPLTASAIGLGLGYGLMRLGRARKRSASRRDYQRTPFAYGSGYGDYGPRDYGYRGYSRGYGDSRAYGYGYGYGEDRYDDSRAYLRSDMDRDMDRDMGRYDRGFDQHQDRFNSDRFNSEVYDPAFDTYGVEYEYDESEGSGLLDTVKHNPLPILLGLGVGWFLLSRLRDSSDDDWERHGEDYYGPDYASSRYRARDRYGSGLRERGRDMSQRAGQAVDRVKDRAGRLGSRLGDRAEHLTDEVKDRVDSLGDKASDLKDEVGDRAQHAVEGVRETAGHLAESAREHVGEGAEYLSEQAQYLGERARYGTRRAKQGLDQMLEEQPLAVGALAIVLGAAIGLAIPSTRKEHELMGETRDHLFDDARERVEGFVQQAQQVAEKTVHDVVDTVKEETSKQGFDDEANRMQNSLDALAGEAKNAADKAKNVAEKAVDQGKQTAQREVDKAKDNLKT